LPPQPKAAFTENFQATQFGPICPQTTPAYAATQSEDCLSINIWTPRTGVLSPALPVMVFIYGGAFLDGSSADPTYDGAYLSASQDVVVVTFNYRLGALGYLAGINGLTGNYGLLDQQLALRWVADNVEAFGGDRSQVMLFGQSAGAMSVGLHLLSVPSSADLFAAALMQSNPLGLPYKTLSQAPPLGRQFRRLLGCEGGGLQCMRGKTAAEIVAAQEDPSLVAQGLLLGFQGLLLWTPVVDGTLVTRQPIAGISGGLPKPTLLGTVKDEGTVFVYAALLELMLETITEQEYEALIVVLFGAEHVNAVLAAYPPVSGNNAPVLSQVGTDYMFFCASRHVAQAGGGPVYAYEFNQRSHFNVWPMFPACADQVCHSADMPYVFHTATNIGEQFLPDEDAVSLAMLAYWSGFARGNNPNSGGPSRPNWPAFPGLNYLVLDTPIGTVVDPPHNCALWDQVGYGAIDVAAVLDTAQP
jgi:acetylcholinesterase/cholinesterase